MKHCKYCGNDLPLEDFDIRRASKDGLSFKCKPCSRQYNKQRYPLAADRFKARAKQWATEHPERRQEIRRASAERHREANLAHRRESSRRARQENLEHARLVGRHHAKLRNERLWNVEGSTGTAELSALFARAGGICVYCGQLAALTIDHFDPIARGGSGSIENLIPCCKPCNSSKNARDGAEWLYRRYGVVGLARAVMFMEDQSDWATRVREVMA